MDYSDLKNKLNNLACETYITKPAFDVRSNNNEHKSMCSQGCFSLFYFYRRHFL